MDKQGKLKVAWFSELQAEDSLSAYFSKETLPYLKNNFDITLYHNSFETFEDYNTCHYLKAFEHDQENDFDIFFYQLEDDPRLNFVRSHIGLIPGITYFHHFNLSNYGPEPLLNSPYSDIIEKFNGLKSEWPDRSKKYKPKGPAAFREASLSPVSIFSTPHSLDEFKRQISSRIKTGSGEILNAFYLPYPVSSLADNKHKQLINSDFKIAFIGSTRIENRAHKVLSALKKINSEARLCWVISPADKNEAESLIKEYEVKNVELVTEFNPESWKRVVSISDCAIHTLFSAYGHNQPYLGISLAGGLPSIVTNFASNESLPDDLVIKIQPGDNEAFQITEALSTLINGNVHINSEYLQKFCQDNFDPRQIALELGTVFTKRAGYLREIKKHWNAVMDEAKKSLIIESEGFLSQSEDRVKKLVEPIFEELGWSV